MTLDARHKPVSVFYQEISSHLRATDEKRDHLLHLYFTIVIAAGSGYALLIGNSLIAKQGMMSLTLCFVVLLLIFSEIVYFSMISARKWHAEYVNCLMFLQSLLLRETIKIEFKSIPLHAHHPFIGTVFTSSAHFLVATGILVICFIWGHLLMISGILCLSISTVTASATAVTILLINWLIACHRLKNAEREFWDNPMNSWCLSGLQTPTTEDKIGAK